MGFLATLLLIAWAGIVSYGILIAAVFGLLPSVAWFGSNVAVAYVLNQARKHSRADAYDDRLSDARVAAAQEWIIRKGGDRKIVEN
jgi:hypothetical protein